MNLESRKTKTIKTITAVIIVAMAFFILTLVASWQSSQTTEVLSHSGSTGSEVTKIQTKLKSWGYFTGNIDGVFNTKTRTSVIAFQKKNGLTADGVAGSATLRALGISSGGGYGKFSSSDYNLLARVISAEARGEPYVGQVAVGAVVLNRVEHPSFPNTVAGVIYQAGAFTCLTDGQFNVAIASSAYRAAQDAINGQDPTGGSIYYYNPQTATSKWIWSRPVLLKIGKHVFCK